MAMNLKKDLHTVNKELNALANKVGKMILAVEKIEKAKTAKKQPAKKTAVKSKGSLSSSLSSIDTVLGIIKRSRKGVDTAALKEKTGIQENVIHNIVYKLKKEGKVKSKIRGVYVKV